MRLGRQDFRRVEERNAFGRVRHGAEGRNSFDYRLVRLDGVGAGRQPAADRRAILDNFRNGVPYDDNRAVGIAKADRFQSVNLKLPTPLGVR